MKEEIKQEEVLRCQISEGQNAPPAGSLVPVEQPSSRVPLAPAARLWLARPALMGELVWFVNTFSRA